jgi:LmbE family N-acetylglucosaminyl deacetylase
MMGMTRRDILRALGTVSAAAPVGLPLLAQAGPAAPQASTTSSPEAGKPGKLKVIVVGGHPDDPETGCGGTMARYAALGHEVVSLYLTRGEAGIRGKSHEEAARIRTAEAGQACKILGARPMFAGQIDGATEVTPQWYAKFRELLVGEKPHLVFVHWPVDTHPDHRAAYMLTFDAWRRTETKFALYFFEVMTGSQTQNFWPTHYVDITATEGKKREACFAHRSQDPDGFYPVHDAMNRFRGMEGRARFAEAFVRYVGHPGEELAVVA